MDLAATLFPESADIVPTAPEAERANFGAIPAKAAVYLLTTKTDSVDNHPVLLATVGDLRAALRRRLADNPPEARTRRVSYGTFCTRVHYRIVYSGLAANFYYAQAARRLFPETAEALIPWRDSWWIAVEREGPFPQFRKTNDLTNPALAYAGPMRDKHAAQRLVESLEDLFDLCRYHHILVQAPHGKACVYKEMGKCPAPCDGSETLESYRKRIAAALTFATGRSRDVWRADIERQMKTAAAGLQFETAARLKQRLTRAGAWQSGPEHRRDAEATGALEDFTFLSLQPGKGKPWIEPWIVHFAGEKSIQCLPQFQAKELPSAAQHLADQCRLLGQVGAPGYLRAEQGRDVALIAHHLFKGDSDHGIWLRLRQGEDAVAIIHAVESLRARKINKPVAEQSTDAVPEAGTASNHDTK
jgi:hypothetical protein